MSSTAKSTWPRPKPTPVVARYFFDSVDGDWFLIPEKYRDAWDRATINDPSTEEECEAFTSDFGEYRTAGGISGFSFADPIEHI